MTVLYSFTGKRCVGKQHVRPTARCQCENCAAAADAAPVSAGEQQHCCWRKQRSQCRRASAESTAAPSAGVQLTVSATSCFDAVALCPVSRSVHSVCYCIFTVTLSFCLASLFSWRFPGPVRQGLQRGLPTLFSACVNMLQPDTDWPSFWSLLYANASYIHHLIDVTHAINFLF